MDGGEGTLDCEVSRDWRFQPIPADSSRFQPLPMNTLLKQEGLQPETSFRHGPNFKDRNIVAGPDGPKSVDSKQLAQFG